MSDKTEFWLEMGLEKDYRKISLDINKILATKEFDILVKIIDKASVRDIDLSPLAKFLKDDILTDLCIDNWKIINAKFIVKDHELLQYFKDRKQKGGTDYTAQTDRWPWVHVCNINIFNLLFDGHIMPTNHVEGIQHGGYVYKSYYKNNQDISNKNKEKVKSSWKKFSTNREMPAITTIAPKFNIVPLTKIEGKICRKKVIGVATSSDICNIGFKQEFVEKLDDLCKSYLHSCSDLQIKLMRAEVEKK